MKNKEREKIINAIVAALEPLDFVYALWEGGAAAFDRVDEWSDIDIIVDVEDKHIPRVFQEVEKALSIVSPIEQKYVIPQPTWHGFHQTFYRLKEMSKYLVIDFAVAAHSNPNKFLEKEIHGEAVVHFDKKGVITSQNLDHQEFFNKLEIRFNDLSNRFSMFQFLIEKELKRGNIIEALAFYRGFTLPMLVELLRIKHSPFHYNFATRYIYYDLPSDIVSSLEKLFFIKGEEDLEKKHQYAVQWFKEEATTLNLGSIKEEVL